jgi:outer membrane protein assembly factor BamB
VYVGLACVAVAGGCNSATANKQSPEGGVADSAPGNPDTAGTGGSPDVSDAVGGSPDLPGNPGPDAAPDGAPDLPAPADVVRDNADGARDGTVLADLGRDLAADGAPDTSRDSAPDLNKADTGGSGGTTGHVSVLQHHNNASRDGFYVDSAMSRAAIASLHMDPAFAGATTSGPTYAQPLYLAGSGGGRDLVIVATEQNHVYAFDAATGGKAFWDQSLGMPLPRSRLSTLRSGCGNIDPLGITGTPIIDATTRTIYLDAMIIANANATAQHQVFALDADTGTVKPGWPVDLNSTAVFGSTTFNSLVQNQRGALALLGGKVFVPFGGHIGDCSTYHGWIIGVSTSDPTQISSW